MKYVCPSPGRSASDPGVPGVATPRGGAVRAGRAARAALRHAGARGAAAAARVRAGRAVPAPCGALPGALRHHHQHDARLLRANTHQGTGDIRYEDTVLPIVLQKMKANSLWNG